MRARSAAHFGPASAVGAGRAGRLVAGSQANEYDQEADNQMEGQGGVQIQEGEEQEAAVGAKTRGGNGKA